MSCKRLTLAAVGALVLAPLLAGCAQTYSPSMGQIDPAEFGEANRQTFAAMVIDPEPVYTDALTTSGAHAQQAIERYRTDRVKQPERIQTGGLTSGGGGGSGTSSGSGGN